MPAPEDKPEEEVNSSEKEERDSIKIVNGLYRVVDKIKAQRKIGSSLTDKLTEGLNLILTCIGDYGERRNSQVIATNTYDNTKEIFEIKQEIVNLREEFSTGLQRLSGNSPPSYAKVAARGLDEIVIKPAAPDINAYDEISDKFKPEEIGINIKKSSLGGKGELRLRLGDRNEIERLENAIANDKGLQKNLITRRKRFIKPRVIIYDVENCVENDELIAIFKATVRVMKIVQDRFLGFPPKTKTRVTEYSLLVELVRVAILHLGALIGVGNTMM